MKRPIGYGSILLAFALALSAGLLGSLSLDGRVGGVAVGTLAPRLLGVAAVCLASTGLYLLATRVLDVYATSKRRTHDARNVLRFVIGAATLVAVLGAATEQWLGVLFSLGVVGFAVTFALQQPLFSLLGWAYILIKRPYQVGDRVAIEESKGDVVDVDFLVTTLWEINGDLVSSNQPSGRIVTLPNSVVLSAHVKNYTQDDFPFVWNELSIQVAYETDLEYARETLRSVADDYLGDEMAAGIERYRERIDDSPVELEVQDRPSVNLVQKESWVELRLRYLVHPRRGQRVRNELYERILTAFNEAPDRVKFPVSRNR